MTTLKKTAIIGCGAISNTHIAAITSLGKSKITALCDINPINLAAAKEKCPDALCFSDYKEMLSKAEIDIVHICTPHFLHAQMAIASMERGCDVYLEKPCAMNPKQAIEIIRASELCGKKVCVSFQNRLNNTTIAAKEIIKKGELGKLVGAKGFVAWFRTGEYYTQSPWRGKFATEGGGVLMNQAIHTLDLLYYFCGKPTHISGHADLNMNTGITEVEDTAQAFIRFESGATAIFYATNCNVTNDSVEIELYFENGKLTFRNDALYKNCDGKETLICENDELLPINGKAYWGNSHKKMIGNFYDALDGKPAYYCELSDAAVVLDIIFEIYKGSQISPQNK